jgi:DNA-binding IclR family transcriptional regulator
MAWQAELAATFPDGPPDGGSLQAGDMARFHRALVSVRHRGYGVNIDESERGISAVDACMHDPAGRAVAALTVSAPSLRLRRARIPQFAEAVRAAARQMEADLAQGTGAPAASDGLIAGEKAPVPSAAGTRGAPDQSRPGAARAGS